MDEKITKNKESWNDHSCMTCHGWGHAGACGQHPWMVFVRVLILFAIFWLGMQLGEIRAFMRNDIGMMGGYTPYVMMSDAYPADYGVSSGYDAVRQTQPTILNGEGTAGATLR